MCSKQCLEGPIQLSCINPTRKSFESKNKFDCLRGPDDDEDDDKTNVPTLTVNLVDAIKGVSKNQMKRRKVKIMKPKVRFMETTNCKCCSDTIFGHFPDSDTIFGHFPVSHFGVDGAIGVRPDEAAAETPGCNLVEADTFSHAHLLGNDGRLGSFPFPPVSVEQSTGYTPEQNVLDMNDHNFPRLAMQHKSETTKTSKEKISEVNEEVSTDVELLEFAKGRRRPGAEKNLNIFNKIMRSGSLMPIAQSTELQTKLGKFEILTAVIDSGATVAVMNPTTGASYKIVEASANGTEYEIASGDTLEDLGEKRMAVLTAEGTMRGYTSRCADVTKSLQSVRALVNAQHAVCFGLGDGHDHLIINKLTGEVNRMRDDGINYLQDLIIVPPDQVDAVAQQLAMIQHNATDENGGGGNEADSHWQGENGGGGNDADFHWQGN